MTISSPVRPLIAIAVTLVSTGLMSCESRTPAKWRTYESKGDGFSVQFSGDVVTEKQPINATTKGKYAKVTIYKEDPGPFSFSVAVLVIEPGFHPDYDAMTKNAVERLKCTRIDHDTSPDGDRTAAMLGSDNTRTIHGSNCTAARFRAAQLFVRKGERFYLVEYVIPGDANPSDAERFLQSFKLISQ